MKNKIACIIILITVFSFPTIAQNEKVDGELIELNNNEDYFELMHQFKLKKDSIFYPLTFALVQSELDILTNNRLAADKSIRYLTNNYRKELGETYMLYNILQMVTNLIDLGKYKETYDMINGFIDAIKPSNPSEEIMSPLYKSLRLAKSLMQHSPKEITFNKDMVVIPLAFKKAGKGELMYIDGNLNGKPLSFMFDTGLSANFDLSEDLVKDYNVRIILDSLEAIGDISSVESKMGIIDSLSLGGITIRNIPVGIHKDKKTQFNELGEIPDSLKNVMQAIIGWRLMESLGEIHIYPKEQRMVFTNPALTSSSDIDINMMLYGWVQPFIELLSGTERIVFHLDTGASYSSLFKKYYDKHQEFIDNNLTQDTLRVAGIDGVRIYDKIFKLPSLPLSMENTQFELNDINIIPQEQPYHMDGRLGIDFIRLFKKISLNFQKMYIRLED